MYSLKIRKFLNYELLLVNLDQFTQSAYQFTENIYPLQFLANVS